MHHATAAPAKAAAAWSIRALFVLPDWQRRGVGRALLTHLTDAFRTLGYQSAILWTSRDNPAARAFDESNGWTFDRHGHFDFHGPRPMSTPAVRYARNLNAPP